MRDELAARKRQRQQERRERDARRGKLGPGRFGNVVKELATVIRLALEAGAIGSKFGLEAPLRQAMRSELCLQGWRWKDADDMAKELMDEALRSLRAERPSYNEGQPEWTIPANTLIERTRCVRCHKPLPEGHHKFCSEICGNSHNKAANYRMDMAEEKVAQLASGWI